MSVSMTTALLEYLDPVIYRYLVFICNSYFFSSKGTAMMASLSSHHFQIQSNLLCGRQTAMMQK